MKLILLFVIGICVTQNSSAQNLEREMLYPDTLRSTRDTFFVNSPKFENIWSHPITKMDTLNLGTSGYKGVYMTIWTDIDTLQIPHVNYPHEQLIKIPIVSEKDTTLCILRFQASPSEFTQEYLKSKKRSIEFELPEVYELANIALFLSKCSKKTQNYPDTDYSRKVRDYFKPFENHKLIQALNANCTEEKLWDTYYGFRENSICYSFGVDNFLQYNTPYKNVYWDGSDFFGGQFRNMLYLVQDFSEQSNFRAFFRQHKLFYKELINRQQDLLPIKQMWSWLENEFPQRMDSYKIVFSPLVEGSHSTQKFYNGFFNEPDFQECIMFINSSESIDFDVSLSERLKQAFMSGIVFTEIDHNYVNPSSSENLNEIKNLISERDVWATKEAQRNYSSEYAIFNEYMTHAIFCLYIKETYEPLITEKVIASRVKLMSRRGYPKFEQFNKQFLDFMATNKSTIYDSYKDILAMMKQIR